MPGRPAVLIAAGDGFSPAEPEFTVTVHGEDRTWPLIVAVRRGATVAPVHDWEPPTRRFELRMTDMRRKVVNAYMEPLRRGRLDPATHREVGEALAYHPNTAREAL